MVVSAHNPLLGGQYQDTTDARLFKHFRASARPSEQHSQHLCPSTQYSSKYGISRVVIMKPVSAVIKSHSNISADRRQQSKLFLPSVKKALNIPSLHQICHHPLCPTPFSLHLGHLCSHERRISTSLLARKAVRIF